MRNLLFQKPDSKDFAENPFWKKLKLRIKSLRAKGFASWGLAESDSIDGQSRSFRVWMFSSFGALICILLIGIVSRNHYPSTNVSPTPKTSPLLDIIPEGYVLVPIEPINLESIDAVLEDYGWADIYREASLGESSLQDDFATPTRGQKRRSYQRSKNKLASGVAIMRAPNNRERFAAIIDEMNGDLISALARPVHLALRRKPAAGITVSQQNSQKIIPRGLQKRFFNIELIEEHGIEEHRIQEN